MTREQRERVIEQLRGDRLITLGPSSNDIYHWRSPNRDGVWDKYLIQQRDTGGGSVVIREGRTQRGYTDADLLEIVRDRLRCRAAPAQAEILQRIEAALALLSREEKT